MSSKNVKSQSIGTATSGVEPIFNYNVIVRVLFYLVFPLALIVIMCNHIYIKQQKKWLQEKKNKKRAKENKLKWLLIIFGIFILEIILVTTIHMWLRWILLWFLTGVVVLWIFVILYQERLNTRIYKSNILDQKRIAADLAEQKVPKLHNHPFLDFFGNITGYKVWAKIEDERFDKISKTLNPISWKKGIIVNRAKEIMVPINIWDMHFLFIGASGFGKTYNLLKLCFAAAYNKYPICVLDGKADGKLEELFKRVANLFNAQFKAWNLTGTHKTKYNPFSQKTRIEQIDMISEIFDYSLKKRSATTNIYAGETRAWVTMLVDFFLMFPSIGGISLENLAKFTVQETIVKCLSKAGADSETIDGEVVKDDEGVVARRKKKIIYKNTPAGDLYRKFNKLTEQNQSQLTILHNDFEELYTNTKDVISSSGLSVKDLMRVNPSGQILLFQFAPNITNKMIEKILLYDIEQLANYNEMQRNIDKKKMVLIIDEAPSILQDQDHVSEMSQQFRSKNITLAFGIQEKAGVEKDNKHGLLNTIINNCSTFFISRLRDKETIEAISAIHGTRKHLMPTDQTVVDADGNISHSGAGSLRVDEEFIWHPNDIRKLLKGQVMFSTLAQQLVNNWPEYKIIEMDDIHANLQVDNIMDSIVEFETKKANLLKNNPDKKPTKSPFDVNLIIKIENMSDAEFEVFRKNKWNDKLQKEGKTFENMPNDFMLDKNTCIENLYKEWTNVSVN